MIKNIVLLLIISSLFIACTDNNTYTNSKQIIYENAKKHAIKYEQNHKEINTTKNSKEILEKDSSQIDNSTVIDMNQALMDFYNEWKSVKYKYGGNSKRGIDCSAFTQRVYKEKFDVKIPRSTRTQVKIGKRIKKSELEMGDLVFFKTGVRDRHVGIYMGNGSFMHASIKGVKFTRLNKPYYKRKYWTSRRVLN